MVNIIWFLSFSGKNDAESLCHFVKIQFLDPKHAKLDQNSSFRHVRTYSWLHKLRNTQGKIHGTYLGNIYGIYKACIANISIDIYDIKYKIITHTQAPPSAAPQWGGRLRRPPHWVCVCDYFIFYIIDIYGYISYTCLIYSIYIS